MKWLIEAKQDCGRWFSWVSIPGVASIVYWDKSLLGATVLIIKHGIDGNEVRYRFLWP
jgi:hypothetical protein